MNLRQDTPQTVLPMGQPEPKQVSLQTEMIQVQLEGWAWRGGGASGHIPDLFSGNFEPTQLCLYIPWKPGATDGTWGHLANLEAHGWGCFQLTGTSASLGDPRFPSRQTPGKWGTWIPEQKGPAGHRGQESRAPRASQCLPGAQPPETESSLRLGLRGAEATNGRGQGVRKACLLCSLLSDQGPKVATHPRILHNRMTSTHVESIPVQGGREGSKRNRPSLISLHRWGN